MGKRLLVLRWSIAVILTVLVLGGAALGLRAWTGSAGDAADGPHFHRRQAEEALQAQDFPRAREHLERCLTFWPAHAETRFLLARTCRRADDAVAWQTHLRAAEALQWPAEEVQFEQQLMQAQAGKLNDVEAPLRGQLGSGGAEEELILEALVKGYLDVYRLPECAHWATYWIERHPERWQPWLYRGRAHYLNHATGRAAADYRQALQIKPDLHQGRLWLASALLLGGQFSDALPEFETYLRDDPDDAAGLLGLATCHLELNQQGPAETTLDRLLAHKPDNAAALLVRARLEMARDAPEQALTWLKKAEAVAPHEGDILNALVLASRQLGRQADAKSYQERLDEIHKQTMRLDEARKQIIRNPKEVAPRYEAGVLCLHLDRFQEALDWLLGALALDPNHQPTHQALADCYEKLGDAQHAAYHRFRAEPKKAESSELETSPKR
jgi:tetratricopeptide (TPR) repeat protein